MAFKIDFSRLMDEEDKNEDLSESQQYNFHMKSVDSIFDKKEIKSIKGILSSHPDSSPDFRFTPNNDISFLVSGVDTENGKNTKIRVYLDEDRGRSFHLDEKNFNMILDEINERDIPIEANGIFKLRSWKDSSGEWRRTMEFHAETIKFKCREYNLEIGRKNGSAEYI